MTKVLHQSNQYENVDAPKGCFYTGTMIEGRLLDNFVLACKKIGGTL